MRFKLKKDDLGIIEIMSPILFSILENDIVFIKLNLDFRCEKDKNGIFHYYWFYDKNNETDKIVYNIFIKCLNKNNN